MHRIIISLYNNRWARIKISASKFNVSLVTRRFFCSFSESFRYEVNYAHKVLLNIEAYKNTTVDGEKLSQNFSFENQQIFPVIESFHSVSDIVSFLHNLGSRKLNTNISKRMANFIKSSRISNESLIEILLAICIIRHQKSLYKDNYFLFNTLLSACISRSFKWNAYQMLLVADIWFTLDIPAVVTDKYYSPMLEKLLPSPKISMSQFIQCFYYMSLLSDFKFGTNKQVVEKRLKDMLKFINFQELGIIAMGFFKTKNFIENLDLLEQIVNSFVHYHITSEQILLCAILKLLRLSLNGNHDKHKEICDKLYNELSGHVKDLNFYSKVQLISVGNQMCRYDFQVIDQTLKLLSKDIPNLRIKDLERMALVIINTDSNSYRNILISIEEELLTLRRIPEIKYHFASFLSCVYYLVCGGLYNWKLISDAIEFSDPNQAENNKKAVKLKHLRHVHLYELDLVRKINLKEENKIGIGLTDEFCTEVIKRIYPNYPKVSHFHKSRAKERLFKELLDIVSKVIDKSSLHVSYIIPYLLPDIIFCSDEQGNIMKHFPISKFPTLNRIKNVKNRNCDDIQWHVLLLVQRKFFSHKVNGTIMFRIQLLQKLGYNVIPIDDSTLDAEQDKITFMRTHIMKNIQDQFFNLSQ